MIQHIGHLSCCTRALYGYGKDDDIHSFCTALYDLDHISYGSAGL